MAFHGRGCDCDDCYDARKGPSSCATCSEELDAHNVAEMDLKSCQECYDARCAFCGLPGNDQQSPDGDKICVHCAAGHQRVKCFADGGLAVQGPCNCEAA